MKVIELKEEGIKATDEKEEEEETEGQGMVEIFWGEMLTNLIRPQTIEVEPLQIKTML